MISVQRKAKEYNRAESYNLIMQQNMRLVSHN